MSAASARRRAGCLDEESDRAERAERLRRARVGHRDERRSHGTGQEQRLLRGLERLRNRERQPAEGLAQSRARGPLEIATDMEVGAPAAVIVAELSEVVAGD